MLLEGATAKCETVERDKAKEAAARISKAAKMMKQAKRKERRRPKLVPKAAL